MYKRVLLKLSGEALKGHDASSIFEVDFLKQAATSIKKLHDQNIQIAVVVGAGNIWRGKLAEDIGFSRVPADFMGMLGTVINAVALSETLKAFGIESVVYSALPALDDVTIAYDKELAKKSMEEGKVVFLAGGTGKPYFTTDTASALRAIEVDCDAILMGKNGAEGVYDSDPRQNKDAKMFKTITFAQMIDLNLQVMDISAVKLLLDKDIEIKVFSMSDPVNFEKVALGEDIGTTCKKG